MLTTIADLLTALSFLLKQNHLLAKSYQDHLLYERLEDGISSDLDRIKELCLACGYNENIALATNSLSNALSILQEESDVLNLEQQIVSEINKIIYKLNNGEEDEEKLSEVFNEQVAKEGLINMLGDIAEKRTRDIYLLRFAE